ncbi:head decoration protein [Nevskia ramosa]|uniref:head decoration protein n=1 Tax=Nevskia ramosa TaxID=64002 RepID=UPI003D0DC8CC
MRISDFLDFAGLRGVNSADPINPQDLVNLRTLQAAIQGLRWKEPVRAASTGNLTLSGTQTVDGVALVVGDRVLAKNQSAGATNGIYVVASGAWTRPLDADGGAELVGAAVFVSEGASLGNSAWTMTTDAPITIGTTTIVWQQFGGGGASYTQGEGISLVGGVIAIDRAVTSRHVSATVGNGSLTQIQVTHGLGTEDVIVVARLAAGAKDAELVDWKVIDLNTIELKWSTAPATGAYRVTVHG